MRNQQVETHWPLQAVSVAFDINIDSYLQGQQGDTGPQGPKGNEGDTKPGQRGVPGDQGDQGDPGPPGFGNGFSDGPQSISNAIRGPMGPRGRKGDQGHYGPKGELGAKGPGVRMNFLIFGLSFVLMLSKAPHSKISCKVIHLFYFINLR